MSDCFFTRLPWVPVHATGNSAAFAVVFSVVFAVVFAAEFAVVQARKALDLRADSAAGDSGCMPVK